MSAPSTFAIESRVQLFSALAEAAEIEHNLMCLYLYAMFSLKRTEAEGIGPAELAAVARWRRTILGVALEEMTHLTLVSNLMSAIGGSPNFMRPNFPSSPGLYPADIVIELAPFDRSTLDHFIYLERPRSQEVADGETFVRTQNYSRYSPKGRLMPTSGDYQTVGALYLSIRKAFEDLCDTHSEAEMFCGSRDQQIGPLDSSLPGLITVGSKDEALKAIDTIIFQGEGATDSADSHFERFRAIKAEYEELLRINPAFVPARPVARNPVMRKPIQPQNRVWVTEEISGRYMDLANALYAAMLRTLVQVYAIDHRPRSAKTQLLNLSYALMHAMGTVAERLTHWPARSSDDSVHAGMSFAMVRSLAPLSRQAEKRLLQERFGEIDRTIEELTAYLRDGASSQVHGPEALKELERIRMTLAKACEKIEAMPDTILGGQAPADVATSIPPEPAATIAPARTPDGLEVSETESIAITFDARKCIHARHCVTELPQVFKANTPGQWIFAEKTHPEILAAVARECPSGAIQYRRKDGGPGEPVPDVNLMRIRENGPYAVLGELIIDGRSAGMRATLCRCGQSRNKPFCDGSHTAANFSASGEPKTVSDAPLQARAGRLRVDRIADGPLAVTGNIEICAGTGRVVLRTEEVRLCRCGNSRTKPICDGSHVAAGFRDAVDGPSRD